MCFSSPPMREAVILDFDYETEILSIESKYFAASDSYFAFNIDLTQFIDICNNDLIQKFIEMRMIICLIYKCNCFRHGVITEMQPISRLDVRMRVRMYERLPILLLSSAAVVLSQL